EGTDDDRRTEFVSAKGPALSRLPAECVWENDRRAVFVARHRRRAGLRAAAVERSDEEARSAEIQSADDAEEVRQGRRSVRRRVQEEGAVTEADVISSTHFTPFRNSVKCAA